jgi:hypothetical protein
MNRDFFITPLSINEFLQWAQEHDFLRPDKQTEAIIFEIEKQANSFSIEIEKMSDTLLGSFSDCNRTR